MNPCPSVAERNRRLPWFLTPVLFLTLLLAPIPLLAQTGTVSGRVTRADDGAALAGVSVTLRGTTQTAVTGTDGKYTLYRVPPGPQVLVFRWIGYQPVEASVTVVAGQVATADASLAAAPVSLGEIVVEGASRAPERVVEAPAAVSVIEPQVLENTAMTGQAPVALQAVPGVDVVQNGMNDFNVNARGFNSSLNRRVLVLQDGRDLSIAFLGAQEWNGLAGSLDEFSKIEVVRGPGSALYGANAFSGVIALSTPTAREVEGTKVSFSAGELSSFRGDFRHAGLLSQGRFGYKLTGGYTTSDTWTRSRTAFDGRDLQREYAVATDSAVPLAREVVALNGQSIDPNTGAAVGDRKKLQNWYGTLRLDWYLPRGHVASAEAGYSRVENEVFVTGIGRVQVPKAEKPYARVTYAAPRFNLMAWWNNRNSLDPQRSLASGAALNETSNVYHVEGQYNRDFLKDNRARVILGSSYRSIHVNTDGTLMRPEDDARSDHIVSAYGQLEYRLNPQVRLVSAARLDDGNLFKTQFSPKAAVVFSPSERHSVHVSWNKAFMTPNYSEWFLRVAAGAPASLAQLEAGLRANPQLGPLLAQVPNGTLFTNTSAVPVLALGNRDLTPEQTEGFELGYKGQLGKRVFVSVDLYASTLRNFVTDLLPGVNPTYGPWTAPAEVPQAGRAVLEQAVRTVLLSNPATALAGRGLTRLQDGSTAIVVSYTNAGRVIQRGIEVGLGYQLTNELRADASFTGFDFEVQEQAVGDQLLPNTPGKKGSIGLSYLGSKFDANATLRLVDGYSWSAGVFSGYVPSAQTVNASAGYRLNNYLRVSATATNVFDQKRFSLYGGAVVGRRLLAGVTGTF